MLQTFKRKFIGTKDFYIYVLGIAVPMIIQNAITNFVSFLDNIMVGQIGTEQMSGVAIANQLIFVFNLCIFGGVSGAGIFGTRICQITDHFHRVFPHRSFSRNHNSFGTMVHSMKNIRHLSSGRNRIMFHGC